ncbi:MAG: M15 family metallopeptidase [Bacilli bacterium]
MNKKNNIYALFIGIISVIFILGGLFLIKKLNNKNIEVKKENNKYQEITNYIEKNLSRYKEYNKLKNLNTKDTVTYVNIGLDYPFYTNIKTIKDTTNPLIIVNKYNALPEDYEPNDLVKISSDKTFKEEYIKSNVLSSINKMFDDAKKDNINMYIVSGYRTSSYQEKLYNKYVLNDGVLKADTYSARKRHSEHETGYAIDITSSNGSLDDFINTKEYTYLLDHAHLYGFIQRYTKEKENITGYKCEPWHYRYVGIEHAKIIKEKNITLEEYKELY